jgi:lipooligosaccharide transport system permease protein
MFLFSGTFFSLDPLPLWVKIPAWFFPLTHVVDLVRGCALGILKPTLLWNLLYLIVFCLITLPLSLRLMRKRLIK